MCVSVKNKQQPFEPARPVRCVPVSATPTPPPPNARLWCGKRRHNTKRPRGNVDTCLPLFALTEQKGRATATLACHPKIGTGKGEEAEALALQVLCTTLKAPQSHRLHPPHPRTLVFLCQTSHVAFNAFPGCCVQKGSERRQWVGRLGESLAEEWVTIRHALFLFPSVPPPPTHRAPAHAPLLPPSPFPFTTTGSRRGFPFLFLPRPPQLLRATTQAGNEQTAAATRAKHTRHPHTQTNTKSKAWVSSPPKPSSPPSPPSSPPPKPKAPST